MPTVLLPRAEVMRRTNWGRSTLAAKVATGEFPAPIRDPVPNAPPLWIESQVEAAIQARIAKATTAKPAPRQRLRDEYGRYIDDPEQPTK